MKFKICSEELYIYGPFDRSLRPVNMIRRIEIHGDSLVIKDNIPIEEAKRIFEEELKNSQESVIVELKEKAQQTEYQPTDE